MTVLMSALSKKRQSSVTCFYSVNLFVHFKLIFASFMKALVFYWQSRNCNVLPYLHKSKILSVCAAGHVIDCSEIVIGSECNWPKLC